MGNTLAGTRLGDRYVLGEVLGRGGMADVYDAIDERLARPVAVKVLRADLAANLDVRRRFESEARAAARLSHPNVVAVYDTGEEEGAPFIVMERLPGETLADRLAAGPVDQPWLRRVAGDVLQALAAAHARGILHRDVKPGNILLNDAGCAKVADFGIAKSTEPLVPGGTATATNMLVGTPAYLAPERIDGEPATPATDLYSVGVMLYEALAGRKPFSGATPVAMAKAIHDGGATPVEQLRPDVDPDFAAVIRKAMAPHAADRFESADAMRAALESDLTVIDDHPRAAAPMDATVPATPLSDPTVLGEHPGGIAALAALTDARSPVWQRLRERRTAAALLLGALALLLILLLLASGSGGSGASTTTVPDQLAAQLRDLATRVSQGDGPAGPAIANELRNVADLRTRGDGAGAAAAATQTLRDVVANQQAGSLSNAAAAQSVQLLSNVPGVDMSATTTTTTAAPAPAPTPVAPAGNHDKPKGKHKKD